MIVIWMDGGFVSTSLGLWTELGLQAVGVQVAAGSSCSVGDVVPT